MKFRHVVFAALLAVSTPAFAGNFGPLQAQDGLGALGLLNHGVVIGHGSSPAGSAVPGTSGNVLTSNGPSADPTFQAPASQLGRLIGVQVFTSSGTYTPDAGTNSIIVQIQAPGGGGGGAAATAAGQNALGASATGGSYIMGRITSGFSGATVTVGAAGTGGVAGQNNGSAGGTTSFGSFASCPGGTGGGGGPAFTATTPSIAPYPAQFANPCTSTPATFQTLMIRTGGSPDFPMSLGASGIQSSGRGGDAQLGGGAPTAVLQQNGWPGNGYGGGGSGGASYNGGAAEPGGNGAPGLIVIWEYS